MRRRGISDGDKVFGFILLMIFVCAFICGTLVYKVFFAKIVNEDRMYLNSATEVMANEKRDPGEKVQSKKVLSVEKLYAVQCGVYKNYEYAKDAYDELKSYGIPFIVEDGDYFKVLFGLYEEELCDSIMMALADKGIETVKFDLTTYIHSSDEAVKYRIDSAALKLVWKMANSGEKTMKTDSYKNWVQEQNDAKGEGSERSKEKASRLPEQLNVIAAEEIQRDFYNEYKNYQN